MGVPGFFAWLLKKYKNNKNIILKSVDKKIDVFYLDANCLIHPQSFKVLAHFADLDNIKDKNKLEQYMFTRIIKYIDYLIDIIDPNESYIAVDGVAPMAKMNQQRKRRFMSLYDNEIIQNIKRKHDKKFSSIWTNTCITPGTEFMENLHNEILRYIKNKNKKIVYSSYHTSGEGEHKILQNIKKKSKLQNDLVNVIYGLDADLIFLAMSSQQQNMYLLREESHFNQNGKDSKSVNELYDILEDVAEDLNFVCIDEFKKCINEQMKQNIKLAISCELNDMDSLDGLDSLDSADLEQQLEFNTSLDNIDFTSDFIFICYFLGNDFLPHLPSIDIKINGLDFILKCYANIYNQLKDNLICFSKNKVTINYDFLDLFVECVSVEEDDFFKTILPKYKSIIAKRRCPSANSYDKDIWEFENMKNVAVTDNIRLGESDATQYKFRYYEEYFKVLDYQTELVNNMCKEYVKGLLWVTKYYFEECYSWFWQYPYTHAPFITDISRYLRKSSNQKELNDINFTDIAYNKQLTPCIQLLAVLPSSCSYLVPNSYRPLLTSYDSPIVDMYPIKFKIDMIGKDQHHKCIPIIPTVEIDRIIDAVGICKLSDKEKIRDKILKTFKNF